MDGGLEEQLVFVSVSVDTNVVNRRSADLAAGVEREFSYTDEIIIAEHPDGDTLFKSISHVGEQLADPINPAHFGVRVGATIHPD